MFRRAAFNLLKSSPSSIRPVAPIRFPASIISAKRCYSDHSETFEEFTVRYVKFFEQVDDTFELQRGLNNCFSYDLVPAPSVIEAALKASRRVNDYGTAVRIFEGIKDKVETEDQYKAYLDELKPLREELNIHTKEELGY
ncbi:Cytochrome c oxidase subunit 6 [Entomophthora muscae]|uniref:Cytochrome c oxidase subunit 6 n=2 Tax=Entomophthora muscae TaxID=34485 RepID=A0ACC2S9A0_9FUNG|nr:Cytochrome c oxidase subunit 6 [Entomophthora muscae]KAJ9064203.1 Cytochrome c oxidase subunit 6 [Entomophthora muscae]